MLGSPAQFGYNMGVINAPEADIKEFYKRVYKEGNDEEQEKIEELLVEFHDIFARHRFDIGMNEEFKVKLTPKDDSPAYSQSLPAPINLKEDILVELAMLHK